MKTVLKLLVLSYVFFVGYLTVRFTYFAVSQEPDPTSVYFAGSIWETFGFGTMLVVGVALPFAAAGIVFRRLQGLIVRAGAVTLGLSLIGFVAIAS